MNRHAMHRTAGNSQPSSRLDRLVSVLIPTFNYGRFIAETLESVRAQTYGEWECLVIDDGSTDDTAAIVSEFAARDARVGYLRQANKGQPAARNAGLRAARGAYVQLLDADDLIESDKLRRQVAFLEADPDVDLVYGDVRYFDSDNPVIRRRSLRPPDRAWMPRTSGRGAPLVRELAARNIMAINSPLVRRALLDRVGPFDESLARGDDWDMWLRCALAGARFEYRDEAGTLAVCRAHATSLTRRDHRFGAASLAIRQKIAESPRTDSQTRRDNQTALAWLRRVMETGAKIERTVPPQRPFVLIDQDELRLDLARDNVVPFTERAGQYWGPPATDQEAVTELDRLCQAGVCDVVVAWPAMWYLDYYPSLRTQLESRYRCVSRDEDVIVYRLG